MRRLPVLLLLLILPFSACVRSMNTTRTEDEVITFNPSDDTEIKPGDHHFTEFLISQDLTVTLKGDVVIRVDEAINIEGTLIGDCTAIEMYGEADLLLEGQITNLCSDPSLGVKDVQLIAKGDILIGSDTLDTLAIDSSGSIFISDVPQDEIDLEQYFSEEEPQSIRQPSSPHLASFVQAEEEGSTTIKWPVRAGEGEGVRIFRSKGDIKIDTSLTAQDGQPAPELSQPDACDNSNNYGGTGGYLLIDAARGTLVISGHVTLTAGDGGKGGSCYADSGCPASAVAGQGGMGGWIIIGGYHLEIESGVTLEPGNGGPGGDAVANADSGSKDCEAGCEATATGGKGGRPGKIRFHSISGGAYTAGGDLTIGGGNGGNGGMARALGGDGQACSTCPAGQGGKGGNATAIGGQGEHANLAPDFNPMVPGSHQGGDGGDAEAIAGEGGDGATCCSPIQEGGEGGAGGVATSTGGSPGANGANGSGDQGRNTGEAGDGGDGGAGDPGGSAGLGGSGVGDPQEIPDGEKGILGGPCFKPWLVFVAYLKGHITHQQAQSIITVLLVVVGNDPEPIPDAEVTVKMIRPDGSAESLSTTTDATGTASVGFTIYSYGRYVISVENVEGDNMDYEPSLNATSSVVIDVSSAESTHVGSEGFEAFFQRFNEAFQDKNVDTLKRFLHPEVIELYGEESCQAYLEEIVETTVNVGVLSLEEFGLWDWEIDGQTIPIENAYRIQVEFTAAGVTNLQELHLALRPDGTLGWFTDCGDPLP
jgi:hypothetical protein